MTCFLLIETSTSICSLALSVNGQLVFERVHSKERAHAALLGVFAWEAVEHARKNNLSIDAVSVSAGPGSYTGLRIGVSEAKGLCYGLDIPFITIPTLKIMAFQAVRRFAIQLNHPIYCPMIDARRMEVFSALYTENLDELRIAQADIINKDSYKPYLKQYPVIFFGNGSDKCRDVIRSPRAFFVKDIHPQVQYMISLTETAFRNREWTDISCFEPLYIKEFKATIVPAKDLR